MDNRYIAYPFLGEKKWICDYEILTDGLSSELGFAYSFFHGKKIKKTIQELSRISLDLNPLVRIPDSSILESLKEQLNLIYDQYNSSFSTFFIPIGNKKSTSMSCTRKTIKQIIRLLYKNESNKELIDVFNLFCNVSHLIYLKYTNKKIIFKSKSYK